jgi:molybdate transport system permease protein
MQEKNEHSHYGYNIFGGSFKAVAISFLFLFLFIILVLIFSDVYYLVNSGMSFSDFTKIIFSKTVLDACYLSIITSLCSLVLVMIFAIPVGYALSRYRFPGHTLVNTFVDIPLILPPVVIGVSLLAFFGTPAGMYIKMILKKWDISLISGVGIVMGQFLVSISYCIRAAKASFDSVDHDFENVAFTLGASPWQVFRRVTLPLAGNGLVAGGVMAWARAIGVFGPLMVFVGTGPRVQVMPTQMWLELSIGNIESSLTIAIMMIVIAGSALAIVHKLAPGKEWS